MSGETATEIQRKREEERREGGKIDENENRRKRKTEDKCNNLKLKEGKTVEKLAARIYD